MEFERGEIVLIPFPAGDHTSLKTRPAAFVNAREFLDCEGRLLVAARTSNLAAHANDVSFTIPGWEAAGLLKPSAVTSWLACCTAAMVRHRIGRLPAGAMAAVDRCLSRALGLHAVANEEPLKAETN